MNVHILLKPVEMEIVRNLQECFVLGMIKRALRLIVAILPTKSFLKTSGELSLGKNILQQCTNTSKLQNNMYKAELAQINILVSRGKYSNAHCNIGRVPLITV